MSFAKRLHPVLLLRGFHLHALGRGAPSIQREGGYVVIRGSGSLLSVGQALGIVATLELQKGEGRAAPAARSAKQTLRLDYRGKIYFVKEYRDTNLVQALKNLLRPSYAARSLVASEILRGAGIDTPRVECVLERRRFFARRSVLIAELCDLPSLDRCVRRGVSAEDRAGLTRDLARLVARLHEGDVFHRDLTSDNLLACRKRGRWQFHLVDLDSLKRKRLSLADRVENLAQLNCSFPDLGQVTTKERLSFLDEYLRCARGLPVNSKAAKRKLLRAIVERTRRMATKPGRHFHRQRVGPTEQGQQLRADAPATNA
jgi:tRNA A-37 threonylcarbamoyl transferase component Bud32